MAYILSSTTTATFGNILRGVVSVQISTLPQVQRLPVIGSISPFAQINQTQISVSLVRYGGGPVYQTLPSDECEDANTLPFIFIPGECSPVPDLEIDGDFFVSSYSFNKNPNEFGQENWSIVDKPLIVFSAGGQFGSNNKILVRGISEGQTTIGGASTGVILDPVGRSEGMTASIAAGNPGIGKANLIYLGVVLQVGGSQSNNDSSEGAGQATIPYQVIDIKV